MRALSPPPTFQTRTRPNPKKRGVHLVSNQVPEDVLLKAFGPDVAQKIADKRGTENVPEIMEKLKLKCVEDKNSDDECVPDEITKVVGPTFLVFRLTN